MNKYLAFVVSLLTLLCMAGGTASAHVLATDGDIGVVLHINPDDSPVSGVSTNYVLAFDDTTSRFRLATCDCTVAVVENGKQISTKALNVSDSLDSSNNFTFPRADVYTLEVSGSPQTANAFQSFKIDFTVRVTSGSMQAQSVPLMLWIGMGGAIGLVVVAAYAMEVSYNDKEHKANTERSK